MWMEGDARFTRERAGGYRGYQMCGLPLSREEHWSPRRQVVLGEQVLTLNLRDRGGWVGEGGSEGLDCVNSKPVTEIKSPT